MDDLCSREKQEIGRWSNNRVENSHLPFRRRERAMLRFRQMRSLQQLASLHAYVQNQFASRGLAALRPKGNNSARDIEGPGTGTFSANSLQAILLGSGDNPLQVHQVTLPLR